MSEPADDVRIGPEIANAWGRLLADAPRLARAIHDTPGTASMLAKVLNGLELISRTTGIRPELFGRRFRGFEVVTDVPGRRIVLKVRDR